MNVLEDEIHIYIYTYTFETEINFISNFNFTALFRVIFLGPCVSKFNLSSKFHLHVPVVFSSIFYWSVENQGWKAHDQYAWQRTAGDVVELMANLRRTNRQNTHRNNCVLGSGTRRRSTHRNRLCAGLRNWLKKHTQEQTACWALELVEEARTGTDCMLGSGTG